MRTQSRTVATPSTSTLDAAVPTDPLALSARQAAKALGVSTRSLWSLTNRNAIPHFRLGRRVLYSLVALEAWLAAKTSRRRA